MTKNASISCCYKVTNAVKDWHKRKLMIWNILLDSFVVLQKDLLKGILSAKASVHLAYIFLAYIFAHYQMKVVQNPINNLKRYTELCGKWQPKTIAQ